MGQKSADRTVMLGLLSHCVVPGLANLGRRPQMYRTILRWTLAAFLALPLTADASGIWSSVASAGGMLDSGTPIYETNGPGITFPLSATSTLLKIRYNVSNTAETNPSWTTFSFS